MVFNGHFRNKAYNSVRWACLYLSYNKEKNEEVPFSMAIGNGNSCTSVFPNTHSWEQQE